MSYSLSIFHAFCLSFLISQTCHVRCELLMILPLIYLILLHGSRHKKIPPRLPERDYFGSRSWRVSKKIKAVIGWLLRTDTVFLELIFPLQEVVTMRTTLLILRGWHLGIAFRFGREKTKPNRTKINRFELVFGSVQKLKKKILVWLFILVQNRTEPKMFSPTHYPNFVWRSWEALLGSRLRHIPYCHI